MIQRGDVVALRSDAPLLARVRQQLSGRVGTVIKAWDPVNGQPTFWEQCRVCFGAQGRKREVTLDLMFKWVEKVPGAGVTESGCAEVAGW